jgi:hypothetical protein
MSERQVATGSHNTPMQKLMSAGTGDMGAEPELWLMVLEAQQQV